MRDRALENNDNNLQEILIEEGRDIKDKFFWTENHKLTKKSKAWILKKKETAVKKVVIMY